MCWPPKRQCSISTTSSPQHGSTSCLPGDFLARVTVSTTQPLATVPGYHTISTIQVCHKKNVYSSSITRSCNCVRIHHVRRSRRLFISEYFSKDGYRRSSFGGNRQSIRNPEDNKYNDTTTSTQCRCTGTSIQYKSLGTHHGKTQIKRPFAGTARMVTKLASR